MPYELIVLGSFIGFAFVLIAGAWLGADPHTVFAGLFAAQGVRDWPTGVQESDVPRFAIEHLDALRPAPKLVGPQPAIVDLYRRSLAGPH